MDYLSIKYFAIYKRKLHLKPMPPIDIQMKGLRRKNVAIKIKAGITHLHFTNQPQSKKFIATLQACELYPENFLTV